MLWVASAEPVELWSHASEDDLQIVIQAVYRQVLGNQYVMDSQRLSSSESLLRDGSITVRGFVRSVAQSDLYRSLFFDTSSAYRFIELNFKHLLGRAPTDQAEISAHVQTYNEQGYAADINSYIDSEEYITNFGENTVPYVKGNQSQPGFKTVDFNRTFALERGFAANNIGKSARLITDLASNQATRFVSPRKSAGSGSNTSKRFRITASTKVASARLNRRSASEYVVDYSQMSGQVQNILKAGGKILSITEVG
ncbi:MAG: phycobilisome rod-core linker polypeptide [Cyanobacteria bacterium P01_F01_bin.150]